MKLGIIGLGKMGANLALQAVEKNIAVIGKARSKRPELEIEGVKVVDNYKDFVSFLEHPRVIYLSLPAGPTVDTVLTELTPYLEMGDVVIDGGNSFYMDSVRRDEELFAKGIYFLDCGTSGGLEGAGMVLALWLAGERLVSSCTGIQTNPLISIILGYLLLDVVLLPVLPLPLPVVE